MQKPDAINTLPTTAELSAEKLREKAEREQLLAKLETALAEKEEAKARRRTAKAQRLEAELQIEWVNDVRRRIPNHRPSFFEWIAKRIGVRRAAGQIR